MYAMEKVLSQSLEGGYDDRQYIQQGYGENYRQPKASGAGKTTYDAVMNKLNAWAEGSG
jgi:hypothetical protein